ncbi:transcription initiation factor TFIID subunit 4-like [Panicum virgatum]|uniref:transcription initiation factor TFIID subunit 4-like n=1 Tax=Panicum virgatum TaxID=38727 RepID=UPI0019D56666|nr:transcription initiation factor TFIID subunit 4-like [Panicum virgatum]
MAGRQPAPPGPQGWPPRSAAALGAAGTLGAARSSAWTGGAAAAALAAAQGGQAAGVALAPDGASELQVRLAEAVHACNQWLGAAPSLSSAPPPAASPAAALAAPAGWPGLGAAAAHAIPVAVACWPPEPSHVADTLAAAALAPAATYERAQEMLRDLEAKLVKAKPAQTHAAQAVAPSKDEQEGDALILALAVAASHLTPYDRLLLDI